MSILDFFRPPTMARYARLLQGKLSELGDVRPWQFDALEERLFLPSTASGKPEGVINLATMYAEYLAASRSQRRSMLHATAMVQLQAHLPDSYADARPHLLPAVRPAAERGLQALQLDDDEDAAFRALGADLEISLVYDTEYAMARLSAQHLADWGVDFDTAYQDALLNLRARSTQPLEDMGGVFRSPYEDCHDAARILLTDMLHRLPLRGAPVVMIPNRSVLLVTGDQNEAALLPLVEAAANILQQPRPLSPLLLRLGPQGWAAWQPPSCVAALQLLRVGSEAQDYAAQKQLLEQKFEREGTDVFVASYSAVRDAQGEVFSYCSWAEGVHSLLPQTDRIAFKRSDDRLVMVPWAQVVADAGTMLCPGTYAPARFEVAAFPSAALLARWSELHHDAVV
ncbi:hypothetical protein SAMN02745857_02170 [Andreprevotia lacus DSM 23236]|jgi:hypothetical protein|uniref:DUF1444 family protein n=1 Tax=Andreprevotia lacus DSM 23236 TaxID=1121001 RepID=A0A1W1XNK1_9NEIS|nr:hypothetical protein [Andreprevotia lacus]SMC25442.1 hypothetical protein SAMN02745857_02170 [Andreprevotia lacus DSM 23236]